MVGEEGSENWSCDNGRSERLRGMRSEKRKQIGYLILIKMVTFWLGSFWNSKKKKNPINNIIKIKLGAFLLEYFPSTS